MHSIRAVDLTVSYQTRARPCLFLFIFLLLLLFTRLLFLSIAFSLPLLSLLPFFSFWFFVSSHCVAHLIYTLFYILLSLLFLDFTFFYFSPIFLVIFSLPYAQFFYSSCCFIFSFAFCFPILRFFLFVSFSPRDTGLKRLAVTSEEEEMKNALPLTVLLSASERRAFWLSLWCVTQYNKQV